MLLSFFFFLFFLFLSLPRLSKSDEDDGWTRGRFEDNMDTKVILIVFPVVFRMAAKNRTSADGVTTDRLVSS